MAKKKKSIMRKRTSAKKAISHKRRRVHAQPKRFPGIRDEKEYSAVYRIATSGEEEDKGSFLSRLARAFEIRRGSYSKKKALNPRRKPAKTKKKKLKTSKKSNIRNG